VRYHVDRDVGILYFLTEYCGGGDLHSVIQKAKRTVALSSRTPSLCRSSWRRSIVIIRMGSQVIRGREMAVPQRRRRREERIFCIGASSRRTVRLSSLSPCLFTHPSPVFLDFSNTIKHGDFGLSKALAQAGFTNTCVRVRHLPCSRSHSLPGPLLHVPRTNARKIRDSESDIWSLGCLLRALRAVPRSQNLRRAQCINPVPPSPSPFSHPDFSLGYILRARSTGSKLCARTNPPSPQRSGTLQCESALTTLQGTKDAETASLQPTLTQHQNTCACD
jgi:serine/threonine protein kinase